MSFVDVLRYVHGARNDKTIAELFHLRVTMVTHWQHGVPQPKGETLSHLLFIIVTQHEILGTYRQRSSTLIR